MAFKILLLPGDGIGPEVIDETRKTLITLNNLFSLNLEFEEALVGGQAIDQTGSPLPESTLDLAKEADAILLGAVGGPKWDELTPESRPEKGLLALRKEFNLFANLRPAVLNPELVDASTLKPNLVENLDLLIVRELTGGLYFGEPRGRTEEGTNEVAFNTMRYSSMEIERIAQVGFECALKRNKKLCSVDKANVLEVSQLWRDVVNKVHKQFPEVELIHMYVDHAAMALVHNPLQFDVIVTENMFGDILSDCAAMLTGSIGMLPSASLNSSGFGLYEPVHGSAPDIAGKNIANPIATLLSAAMLLKYSLNHDESAVIVDRAITAVLKAGHRTLDIAKTNEQGVSTQQMGELIRQQLKALL